MGESTAAHAGFHQPLTWGAETLPDGTTRFRLWAPDASSVLLATPDATQAMAEVEANGEAGWFELLASLQPGSHYRYVVNGNTVPDPAARALQGGPHGWCVLTEPPAYPWQTPFWRGRPWQESVICEVHAGALGGFAAMRHCLPEWVAVGYTAIQLMPIGAFAGERNWGYDGVLPYAPQENYGTPDELKAFIDSAHGMGLQVFLDVVYNHFGPDGNYLGHYARSFFRDDRHTPWGSAIDYRATAVNDYFIDNALYWLNEFRFDGLRFDAVHAFKDERWLHNLSLQIRARLDPERHIHLMLENEDNQAEFIGDGLFDAQWNDDAHNALHVLLTGEQTGYYQAFAEQPAAQLARCLAEGFAYQGEPSANHAGAARGTRSAHLPPASFIFFLQNHDQIGNRVMGERLLQLARPAALRAAKALQLLCPQIPLCFMGEEWGAEAPFLYFTDHEPELAQAIMAGRNREFAAFTARSGQVVPDANVIETFQTSNPGKPDLDNPEHTAWLSFTRELLAQRERAIVPYLHGTQALHGLPLGDTGVVAQWQLGNGLLLTAWANFSAAPLPLAGIALPAALNIATDDIALHQVLFETPAQAASGVQEGELAADSCVFFLQKPPLPEAQAVVAEAIPLPVATIIPLVQP
ncbi:Malto-oligosyltrehalose trehalohydrolase [Andreprevotia sp. IGB-42]|uniref:malto-oligosyltrehalose trehalohydrolase n=1 Tax=Andreprevotia sp. IGB-42 TaxID=2497473 RepID=UPI001359CBDA|nr:malto-oligosyltrehalose trehalohydrolase [Andreprevotia sp. IGB-42]KAF0813337.1 Malto-oligosyltrehalose trehalohydrolase [Andreprevotia sp. IGB-42]